MMSREQMFSGIQDIEVKDALLAEAIQSLSEKRQKVVLQNIVKPKISKAVQIATFRGQQGRISRPVKAILSGRL